ncbi:MAG TPA: hypothetical protein VFU33_01575 [Gaiellaceae bacterium]|nr:hypothetical protein [Gaiellaceae bacterium]
MAVAVVAAVLVPVASASPQPRLALLPLPRMELGAAGRSLPLAADSGVDSNAHAASQTTGNVTAARLKRLGRISGYLLDYGTPFTDSPRVSEIQTEVERYRTAAAARKSLGFWRKQELDDRALKAFGLDVSFEKVALAHVANPYWAYLNVGRIQGLKPVYAVDAELVDGAYLLDVSIGAGSPGAAKRLAPVIAQKLLRRFHLAQEGRLHAKPIKLQPAKPGPPARGPKPSRTVLTRVDVGSPTTIRHAGYVSPRKAFDQYSVSAYDLAMAPAGSYAAVEQEVSVARSALEVKYFAALAAGALAQAAGGGGAATKVDLGSVGDNAFGELVQASAGGSSASEAIVVLSRGKYLDFVVGAAAAKLTAADVQSIAHKAAHRLNLAVPG